MIISTAPLIGIPLTILFTTQVFGAYLGCIFTVFPSSIDSPGTLVLLGDGISSTFAANLVTRLNGWFLLYLYLTLSLVLSVAPSMQDMKNAAAGTLLMTIAGILIAASGIPFAEFLLAELIHLLATGFTLGLLYESIALAISLPLMFWYIFTHHS